MKGLDAIVIGAGQAGLSSSYCLRELGLPHLVLERDRVASGWRRRWDSFRMATPNAGADLPGQPFPWNDPDGFMTRDEVVSLLERYARSFAPPIRCGVAVHAVEPVDDEFVVHASDGTYHAASVVVATGLLQEGWMPSVANRLPERLRQLHSDAYRNAAALPAGAVLVVGSGLSGTQIAHDLNQAGRRVYLSVGSNGRVPRRYRGRDIQEWIGTARLNSRTPDGFSQHAHISEPGPDDLALRALASRGVTLVGHVEGARDETLLLSQDLAERVAWTDRFDREIRLAIDTYIREANVAAPPAPAPPPVTHVELVEQGTLDLWNEGVGVVVWATGYRYDYAFVRADVFDASGWPQQDRGVTDVPGLYFVGMNWRDRPLSAFLPSVGAEAERVAHHLANRAGRVRRQR